MNEEIEYTWQTIDRDEFHRIIAEHGGIEQLGVYAASTEIAGEIAIGGGHIAQEDNIYTEWYVPDTNYPLVSERRRGTRENPVWTFRKAVLALAQETNK